VRARSSRTSKSSRRRCATRTATVNDWGAVCWSRRRASTSAARENLEIFDRVGGGDSFASGLIYGLLTGRGPQWAVECGARTARSR
jgi:2-dehydro-3-deoxygluconokinase